jgi:hypothetical protein
MARAPSGIGLTSTTSIVGRPSSPMMGSSVNAMLVAQRRGQPTYSEVTIMSASDLLRASPSGLRSLISLDPKSSTMRSGLRRLTTGAVPSGLVCSSTVANPGVVGPV